MDAGWPWTCTGCGAGNAGYRKRCLDCGGKRSPGAEPATPSPAEPVGKVDVVGIPLPRLARRPRRGLGRVPAMALAAAVLGLAAYGAITYFGADGRSVDDDVARVRAALLRPDEIPEASAEDPSVTVDEAIDGGGILALVGDGACDEGLGTREEQLLEEGSAVVVEQLVTLEDGGLLSTLVVVFDVPSLAGAYQELAVSDEARGCGIRFQAGGQATAGRAWVAVDAGGWSAYLPGTTPAPLDRFDVAPLLDRILERLELEG